MMINREDMANLFEAKFKKTNLYRVLEKQFEQEEIDVYLENFGHLCCELGEFHHNDLMMINATLKHQLLIDRQLIMVRTIQKRIDGLEAWLLDYPSQPEHDDKETIKLRIMQQRNLDNAHSDINRAYDIYNALRR